MRGGNAPGVIDFSSNTGPLSPPRPVIAALSRGADGALAYPDPDAGKVRTALSARLRVSTRNIMVGSGATEIIYEYCRAFVRQRTRVLVQAPTFAEYASASRLSGAIVDLHHAMDISDDMPGFVSRIPRRGCVFVCNPNNPTGTLLDRRCVLEIVCEAARRGSQVLVDECFIEMCKQGRSVVRDVRSHDNLFVLRSFTKLFGVPGVRIGYGIGTTSTASALRRAKVPWTVSRLAQSVAIAALGCKGHVARTKKAVAVELRYLQNAINATDGFRCAIPSVANFVLVRSSRLQAASIRSRLLKRGILIRDCSSFDGLDSSFIRIAVRTRRENMVLVKELGAL